jgi:DNA-binding LacI/PurR family transcriptional regulator
LEAVRGATSNDVARLAGVSQATVSLVFAGASGRTRVSSATRERVHAAAESLGYSPHPLAQALRRRRSGILALVPRFHRTAPAGQPVPFQFSLHLTRAALRHGFHVIEVGAEGDPVAAEGGLVPFLRSRRVDGVIFDGPDNPQDVERVVAAGLPVVQAIRPQFAVETATVMVDPAPGIGAAIDHLVALGHRRIAFVGRGGPYPTDRTRLDAFQAALARHAMEAAATDLVFVADYSVDQADDAVRPLLTPATRPTAVFAAGDNLALGVLRALYEFRIRVPDEMSLISYDDIFAADLYPPLASVAQPLADVGEQVMTLITALLDPARTKDQPETHLLAPTHFVIRRSTCPPRVLIGNYQAGSAG